MKSLIAVVVLLASALQAQKEAPLPKDLPPYGTQATFAPPAVKASKLPNGLTVWLVPQPGLPMVALRVVVLGGLAADPSDRPGMSELLAKALTQGTKTRSARQIAEQIQAAGGDLESDDDRDTLTISTTVLSSKADAALDLLGDVLENASFPDAEVELARRNVSDSLRSLEAEPDFQASRALAHVLFGSGPYGVISPTQESLAHMTPAEVRREFSRRFRPDESILVAVGDFDPNTMAARISSTLGVWKSPASPPVSISARPTAPAPHSVSIVARPNSVQTTLLLAGFAPLRSDPDYEAAQVANAIFGGSFTSRLVVNIREDKGYTYSPGSGLSTLRQAGYLRSQADVRNQVTGASLNEIFYELNRMATTSPTDEELSRAKRYLLGLEAIRLQSRAQLAGELTRLWLNGLGPDGIATYNSKVNATSTADVDSAGRKYFAASHMVIVAVGDEKVIRDAFQPFGIPLQPGR